MCVVFFLSPLQICPICAALPGGDPNHVTDDFTAHLTLEHRAPRDLISFLCLSAGVHISFESWRKKTDLLCVTWLHFVFLNWLLFTMSPAVFDTYVGCSTLGEDWVDPEHDAQICTLLAAPQVDFHLPPHKVQVILPVTEKQWTLSQVRWVVITHKTPVVQDSPPHIHTQTNIKKKKKKYKLIKNIVSCFCEMKTFFFSAVCKKCFDNQDKTCRSWETSFFHVFVSALKMKHLS